MKMEKRKVRIVAKGETIISKGERAGEIVYRLSFSDDADLLQDVMVGDDVAAMWSDLVLYSTEYDLLLDYSPRTYNGSAYVSFKVVSIVATPPNK